jgi:hypothetical protein
MQPARRSRPRVALPADVSARDDDLGHRLERLVRSRVVRSGYASLVGHVVIAMLLALWAVRSPSPDQRLRPLVLEFSKERSGPSVVEVAASRDDLAGVDQSTDEAAADDPAEPETQDTVASEVAASEAGGNAAVQEPPADAIAQEQAEVSPEDLASRMPSEMGSPVTQVSTQPGGLRPPRRDRSRRSGVTGGVTGIPFASRQGAARAESVKRHGGTAASELAVSRGLEWLAAHQGPDGSWRCDLANCRCRGACRNPGSITGSIGPTALALLPFLGAGSTHLEGPYQATVSRGLYFLATSVQPTPRGGDLCEGSMYAHGIAVLAMAEAYGMTNDDFLQPLLNETVRFVETSQDPHGGGWRYLPGQAGDTTVTGWQVAALKSATMAGIPVRSPVLDGVGRFLDSVQSQAGAAYGYRTPAAKPSTSAVGLLCRMYTGWPADHEALQRGIGRWAGRGPDPNAIYENFYLAQVLMQADHPVWPRWNATNREQIIRQQATHGHEAGSWFFADADSAPGGRLAHTALAVLTLEVYYRLLPIYGEAAVASGF